MELLKQQIEALIFCSEQSISISEISASLKISFDWDLENEELLEAINEIKAKYSTDEYAFELIEVSEGYQLLTKKQYHPAISALIQHKAKKKLSVSQMETLAIIAYRQPISKGEVEHIRGVSCDYAIQKLLEKELVEISGKSDGPGRPIIYSTSKSFMDYFGIKSVKDLPQLKDLHMEQNEIGRSSEEIADEQILPSHIFNEPESEIVGESEEALYIENDEIITSAIESNDLMNLPDRKSIFLENEKNDEEIENSDLNEREDQL